VVAVRIDRRAIENRGNNGPKSASADSHTTTIVPDWISVSKKTLTSHVPVRILLLLPLSAKADGALL
jgi:hypothetical protein